MVAAFGTDVQAAELLVPFVQFVRSWSTDPPVASVPVSNWVTSVQTAHGWHKHLKSCLESSKQETGGPWQANAMYSMHLSLLSFDYTLGLLFGVSATSQSRSPRCQAKFAA